MRRFAIFALPKTSVLTDRRRMRYCITYYRHPSRKSLSASWWSLPRVAMLQS